jgi:hypothetical protein
VTVGSHGLVLVPSAFCWPRVYAATRPVTAGTLRFPARGIAPLWESRDAAPEALWLRPRWTLPWWTRAIRLPAAACARTSRS